MTEPRDSNPMNIINDDQVLLDSDAPLILLTGTPRSGKSSLVNVVMQHHSPSATVFNEPTLTPQITHISIGSHFEFLVMEAPTNAFYHQEGKGPSDYFFQRAATLLVVVDSHQVPQIQEGQSTEDHFEALKDCEELLFCRDLIIRAQDVNPDINVDVFVHKMDGHNFVTFEQRNLFQSLLRNALLDILGPVPSDNTILFSTTIYDYSAREAMGHILQRILPQTDIMTALLDVLVNNCQATIAFLLDTTTGLCLGADSAKGFDPVCFELCSDMLDIVSTAAKLRPDHSTNKRDEFSKLKLENCSVSMNNGYVIQLRQIDNSVSLALLMKEDAFDVQHLVDVNVEAFSDGLQNCMTIYKDYARRANQTFQLPTEDPNPPTACEVVN